MLQINQAIENDIPIIEDILLDTVCWLDSIGQSLWREEQVKWSHLSRDYSITDFYIALLDNIPAACVAITDYDPLFWSDVEKGKSLFIHKLAVKRFAAGKGLSDALINHAKSLCIERKISFLRLDCSQDRPKQRYVYERNGFVCVDERVVFDVYPTTFYVCEVN